MKDDSESTVHSEYVCSFDTPLGRMTASSNGKEITGLWFEGQKYYGSTLRDGVKKEDLAIFRDLRKCLDSYFKGDRTEMKIPLSPSGSEFRRSVWKILSDIPYGEVITYGQIAKQLEGSGGKVSAQAVGGAVGHNPISIIIPCHRVIGSDGSLTGYAGGIDRKMRLLEIENVCTDDLKMPSKGTAL